MKATYVLAAAGLAAAQLGDLSSCAIGCLVPALTATGCSLTDLQCACSADNQAKIRSSATSCLEKCTPDEQAQALAAANALCGGGVSGIPSSSGASSTSATGTTSSTGSSSATTSATGTTTGTSTGTSTTGSASSSTTAASSSGVSSGMTTAISTNGTHTTGGSSSTSKPTTTGNPGTNAGAAPAVGIVAALLGAAFAL